MSELMKSTLENLLYEFQRTVEDLCIEGNNRHAAYLEKEKLELINQILSFVGPQPIETAPDDKQKCTSSN